MYLCYNIYLLLCNEHCATHNVCMDLDSYYYYLFPDFGLLPAFILNFCFRLLRSPGLFYFCAASSFAACVDYRLVVRTTLMSRFFNSSATPEYHL